MITILKFSLIFWKINNFRLFSQWEKRIRNKNFESGLQLYRINVELTLIYTMVE